MKLAVKQQSNAHYIAAAAAALGTLLNFSRFALGQSIWMLLGMAAFAIVVVLTGKRTYWPRLLSGYPGWVCRR